jgi:pyruvate/2-oxoacid:ferredoxin oxidoreductase beta subunit
VIQRRLRTCEACGFASMEKEFCPACGNAFAATTAGAESGEQFDVSNVTIDVQVLSEDDPPS